MMNVADVSSRLKPIINTLNRFSAALLLLAIVWLCWSAARLLWLLLAAPLAPALPLAPLQNTANTSTDHSGLFAIFADPDPIAAPVQPPPNVLLKGVLIAIPESLSSAMLDVNGEVKNYRIGDTLKDSDYTLVAVDWNEVIIADAYDKEVVIRMPEAMPLDQSAMLAGAVSNQRLPDNSMLPNLSNAPMPEQGNPEMQPNGDASNDSEPQSPIDEAVTELQSNPASYLSRMGVMASGESYQVTAAMPAKLRNRLGLEPGDKVLTVNTVASATGMRADFANSIGGKSYGFELAADWKATDALNFSLAYSYIHLSLDDNSSAAEAFGDIRNKNTPQHQLSMRGSYKLLSNLQINLWGRYHDNFATHALTEIGGKTYDIDSSFTLDANLIWAPVENLELMLAGQNLLDSRQLNYVSEYAIPPTEIERSIYGKVTWRF